MSLIDRVKNILVSPKTEWDVIEAEDASANSLITGYVIPLAAVAAIAAMIGSVVFGVSVPFVGTVKTPFVTAAVTAVFQVLMAVIGVYLMTYIVNFLAPNFGGEKNQIQAMKLVSYAYTPSWVAGILAVIPALGMIAGLIGGLYGIYLVYLGLPKLMKNPGDKTIIYMIVVFICAVVVMMVLGLIVGVVLTAIGMGAM